MKLTAVRFFACALVFAGMLAGCSSDEHQSEDDFLDSVREDAKKDPTKGSEEGNIDPNSGSVAKIEPETIMFELGNVSNTEFTYKEMYIFNRGEAPLEINNITTTCNCTTATMKEGDSVIEPGGEGVMIIKYDPSRASSYFTLKKLTIHSNDPTKPQVYVDVSAHVEREMIFEPEKIPQALIEEGKGGEIEIRIIQNSDFKLELQGFALVDKMSFVEAGLTLLPEEEWKTAGRREYLIKLKVLASAPSGLHKNTVQFGTNIRRLHTFTLPLSFRVAGNYLFEPEEITLRSVEPGVTMEDVLTLTSKLPISITSAVSSNENIALEHKLAEDGMSATFNITVPERPENRLQKDTWTITFNVGEEEITREINVVALLSRQ